jgi:hypothetical protein
LIALEEYYLLIVVVLPVQFYETMAVHTVRVLGMHLVAAGWVFISELSGDARF